MRILHTIASLASIKGGPSRCVPQLAKSLFDMGNPQAVWAGWGDAEEQGGVLAFNGKLSEAIAAFRPDLVHDHGLWLKANRQSAAASLEIGIPRVVSPHGMLMPWSLSQGRIKKKVAWFAYQRRNLFRADALLSTAQLETDQLRFLGYKGEVLTIPNGIEVPAPGKFSGGCGGRQRTAVFISRIHPKKGLPLLIKAWSEVRPEGWRMRVIGPDSRNHRAELELLAKKAGLSDVWEFESELLGDEKWRAYSEADLFVLPSWSENFGIVIAEALAMGTPVLTTTETPWEGLLEHECGWWVRPDATELATSLRVATSLSPSQLASMGERGSAWVRGSFSWPGVAEQLVMGYSKVLAQADIKG